MGIDEGIPPHVRQNISTGEEIISAFRGNYKRKSKSSPKKWNNCLLILTTEKLLIDSEKKKAIEKLFLSNVLSLEHVEGKSNIKIFYSPRATSDEDKITLDIQKNKGEKKDDFNKRIEEISQNIEVFYNTAEEASEEAAESSDSEPSIIPDLIIKPTSPIGVPFSAEETKKEKPVITGKRFCPECGQPLPPGGKFCASCGVKVK